MAAETIALIRELAAANRFWGTERIPGEPLKLGAPVAKTTVLYYAELTSASLTVVWLVALLLASVGLTGGGAMVWSALAQLVALLLDVPIARRRSAGAQDLAIAVLRHQLRMLERRRPRPRLSRWARLTLALLATKLRHWRALLASA